ncbi:hypothetical protein LMG23992_01462 [Cupriavidus laharis]|uniref:DUF5666 domain-containing protein n=2 Tax=Cupriavidus laharis TaxID=151654 RepID=A0ABM8WPL7_9BURK|nr:hypothetical protein LMG23992_01462 [Cupriavidus laharis]
MATSACSAPSVGARITLEGKIRVKGNAMFPVIVLQQDDGVAWELSGMTTTAAREQFNRVATVHGIVVRARAKDTWMPGLRVESVESRPAP